MIYIVSILFTLFFVLYTKYQVLDLRNFRNIKWKIWGVAMRAIFFIACYLLQIYKSPWQDYLLAGTLNIFLFEIGVNIIGLKASIFYNGASSIIDNKLGKYKWFIITILIIISLTIKIFVK